jgi:predicted CoA-binding protein
MFTKVVTNTYQYETEVDSVEVFRDNRYDPSIVDSFTNDTLVDVHWYIDVEEV